MTRHGIAPDEICNRNGCPGTMEMYNDGGECSCHLSPPCGWCIDAKVECDECYWCSDDDEVVEQPIKRPVKRHEWTSNFEAQRRTK